MSLEKIEKSEYDKFIPSAKSCTANKVYPMSIAEGYQEGDIYSDGDIVMFWHYCGFVYFSGSPSEELLEEVYEDYLSREQERRFVIITDDEKVKDFFSSKSDVVIDERYEYIYDNSKYLVVEDVKASPDESVKVTTAESGEASAAESGESLYTEIFGDGARISVEEISEKNIERIHGRIIPSFSWDSSEAFLEKGLGYVAADGEKIAAVAFSSAVSSEEIDIGVETDPDYRRRGLSAKLTSRMCDEIIREGKSPVWAHAAVNVASGKTAERAGFVKTKINYVIHK